MGETATTTSLPRDTDTSAQWARPSTGWHSLKIQDQGERHEDEIQKRLVRLSPIWLDSSTATSPVSDKCHHGGPVAVYDSPHPHYWAGRAGRTGARRGNRLPGRLHRLKLLSPELRHKLLIHRSFSHVIDVVAQSIFIDTAKTLPIL